MTGLISLLFDYLEPRSRLMRKRRDIVLSEDLYSCFVYCAFAWWRCCCRSSEVSLIFSTVLLIRGIRYRWPCTNQFDLCDFRSNSAGKGNDAQQKSDLNRIVVMLLLKKNDRFKYVYAHLRLQVVP